MTIYLTDPFLIDPIIQILIIFWNHLKTVFYVFCWRGRQSGPKGTPSEACRARVGQRWQSHRNKTKPTPTPSNLISPLFDCHLSQPPSCGSGTHLHHALPCSCFAPSILQSSCSSYTPCPLPINALLFSSLLFSSRRPKLLLISHYYPSHHC